MCGIIGIISETPVADRLVDGLKRMEYRGYDSSGVCTIDDGQMIRRRAEGKLANLVEVLKDSPAPRAGQRMARRPKPMRTLTRARPPRWFIMASSRISAPFVTS